VNKNTKGTKVSPLSTTKIRNVAMTLRQLLGVPEGAVNIVDIFEFQLAKMGLEYEIMPEQDMQDEHGLTIPSENVIRLREDVYNGACNDNGRDRFTIGHELGHLVLHSNVSFARAQFDYSHKIYEDSEWQANTFAAEFLMPVDEVKRYCTSPFDIADRFQVSVDAAVVRYNKLKKEGEI